MQKKIEKKFLLNKNTPLNSPFYFIQQNCVYYLLAQSNAEGIANTLPPMSLKVKCKHRVKNTKRNNRLLTTFSSVDVLTRTLVAFPFAASCFSPPAP